MSLKGKARSAILNIMTSKGLQSARRSTEELKRRLKGGQHVVTVFLELDDPYSYLLSHYLPELVENYDIDLDVRLTEAITADMRPAPELYDEYTLSDCRRLATELGVPLLDRNPTPPVELRRALLDALAGVVDQPTFHTDVFESLAAYWRGDAKPLERRVEESLRSVDSESMLADNRDLLEQLGHYNPATLHYGGEWYWGVDRIGHLVARLEALELLQCDSTPPKIASVSAAMQLSLPVRPPAAARALADFELFYSFRSPYSWLSLRRMLDIVDAFDLQLKVRPVLPMVMRGMAVPKAKMLYIAADASREARRHQVPFGNFADPVGAGVERCMAVFEYAVTQNRVRDFLLAAGEAIWAKGIDVATDTGLRKVTGEAGLFWPEVQASLADEEWRMKAEANQADMMNSGAWGVPTVRIGEFVTWGQDRDWLVARHLEDNCDTGEGILV